MSNVPHTDAAPPGEQHGRQRDTDPPGSGWRHGLAVLVLVGLGLALYVPGLDWGLPALTSWSQDTIAGARSLGPVEDWPDEWRGRYAPLHYLINVACYRPLHAHWIARGWAARDTGTGRVQLKPEHVFRVADRYRLSRWLSVAMAILAGLGVWAATIKLTRDSLAGLMAAIILMIGATYTYFSHLGNVDIPSIFWLSASAVAYVHVLRRPTPIACGVLGLLASLAVCTKDGTAGVYPGMAIVLLWQEARRRRHEGATLATAGTKALLQMRWLIGLVAFALPYLYINGVLHNPHGFANRMTYWLDDSADTLHAAQYRYPDQVRLAIATAWYAGGAVGWPMLAAMTTACVVLLRHDRRTALVLLIPATTYYLIIIAFTLHFVYARFLLPPLLFISIVTGIVAARWWRRPRPAWLRIGLPALIALPSLGYAAAVDIEMRHDARYACEAWFDTNVHRPSSVLVLSDWQYLPRLREMGYRAADESFNWPDVPQYIVLTHYNYEDFDPQRQARIEDLMTGRAGFDIVAHFGGWRYLGTGSHWLSLAGWGTLPPGKISPRLTVLRRQEVESAPPAG